METLKRAEKINEFIFWMVPLLFFIVSLVPFFVLKHIKILIFPLHYLVIGGTVGLLLILTWFSQERKITTFDKWLLVVVFSFSLSLITSVNRLWTIRSLASFLIRGLGISFVVSKMVIKEKKGVWLVKIMCFIAVIVALIGIIEYLFGRNLIFYIFPVSQERMSWVTSTVGHHLPFASYLVMFIPLSLWLAERNVIYFLPTLIIFMGIFFSFSRISLIAILVILLVYFLLGPKRKIFKKNFPVLIILCISSGAIFFLPPARNFFSQRFNFQVIKLEFLNSHRTASYITTKKILKKSPIFGIGFGNYLNIHQYFSSPGHFPKIKALDNMYLTILNETGIFGFLVFFAFLFWWFRKMFSGYKAEEDVKRKNFLWALICSISGFLLTIYAYEGFYWLAPQFTFWMFLGIGIGSYKK